MGKPGEKAFGLLTGVLVKGQKDMDRCLTAMALEDVALKLREGGAVGSIVRPGERAIKLREREGRHFLTVFLANRLIPIRTAKARNAPGCRVCRILVDPEPEAH